MEISGATALIINDEKMKSNYTFTTYLFGIPQHLLSVSLIQFWLIYFKKMQLFFLYIKTAYES